ncbi:alcohol dehydrogenase [Acidobacteria bacterium Mor1]|nr:alcohol dehydrogenase [Acidobacteria bacterium Mor1]
MIDRKSEIAAARWDTQLNGTRVLYGAGALERLGELVAELGLRKVLLVSDDGVCAAGHVERARKALGAERVAWVDYDGVQPNPTSEHVEHAAQAGRDAAVDGIIALGGGSVMDCAKGANFILTQGGRMEDYWGYGKAKQPMLPSVGIPTTAGTGSEAQCFALITHPDTHAKMACGDPRARFRMVVLDPELTASAPRDVIAMTGMDAVSHAVESYVTRTRNPVAQAFAREAWQRLDAHFAGVLDGSADVTQRGSMLVGAHLAGAAIEHSMLGAAHACANPLTARFDVVHGAAVGLMLPATVRFNSAEVSALYDDLHRGSPADRRGVSLVDRVVELRSLAGLPARLRDCAITEDSLGDLADEAARQWTAGFNPRPVTETELRGLYEASF